LPWILEYPWFRAVGLNFEPFDQIPNFLFKRGFKPFWNWKFVEVEVGFWFSKKFKISLVQFLDLWKDSNLSLKASSWIQKYLISILSFESKVSLVWISNFFDLNHWAKSSNSYFLEGLKLWFQIQIHSIQISNSATNSLNQISKSNMQPKFSSLHFETLSFSFKLRAASWSSSNQPNQPRWPSSISATMWPIPTHRHTPVHPQPPETTSYHRRHLCATTMPRAPSDRSPPAISSEWERSHRATSSPLTETMPHSVASPPRNSQSLQEIHQRQPQPPLLPTTSPPL
jgi:hypothetical protein